jgi:pimeloyl-[acyl-carrier protein] methyl ester esterase
MQSPRARAAAPRTVEQFNSSMAPALVLLPGMDGTGELFAPLLTALGPDIAATVVRYPDKPLDYTAHEEVAALALPLNSSYILLGESFSGPIAVSLAARAPRGLLGYVLCCSFVTPPRALLRPLRPLLGFVSPQRVSDAVAAYFLMGRFATPELRRLHSGVLKHVSPAALVARLKAIASVDVRNALPRISLPGLYLRATEDRLVPSKVGSTFTRLAPRARIVDIVGPHFLAQCNPAAVAGVIREFLRECQPSLERTVIHGLP